MKDGADTRASRTDGTLPPWFSQVRASVKWRTDLPSSMELQGRRRDEFSAATVRLARVFGVRSGQFVTALQIPFSSIYLPLLAALALSSEIVHPQLAVAGAGLTVAGSVFARYVRTLERTAPWVPAALCSACFAALGLLAAALGSHGYLVTVLALLPATWLAYAYLWRGAVWGVLATGVLMAANTVADTGERPPLDGAYYAVLPLVALAMTSACVLVTEGWEVQRSKLRAERARLDDALADKSRTAVLLEAMLDSLDSSVVAFDTDGQMLLSNASHLYPLSWAGVVGASPRVIFEEDGTTPVPMEAYPSELAKQGITVDERLSAQWLARVTTAALSPSAPGRPRSVHPRDRGPSCPATSSHLSS